MNSSLNYIHFLSSALYNGEGKHVNKYISLGINYNPIAGFAALFQ